MNDAVVADLLNKALAADLLRSERKIPLRALVRESLDQWGGSFSPGDQAPTLPGCYQRLSLLGLSLDVWDGKLWRRLGHRVEPYAPPYMGGVVCANQDLPWRRCGPA